MTARDYIYGSDILGADLIDETDLVVGFTLPAAPKLTLDTGWLEAAKKGTPTPTQNIVFDEDEVIEVKKPPTKSASTPPTGSGSPGLASLFSSSTPAASPPLQKMSSSSPLSQPLWNGGPKLWQGALAGAGLSLMAFAILKKRGRR